MKTKHNVFVPVGSQQEAERMEKVLRAMGEEISIHFYPYYKNYTLRTSCSGNWLIGDIDSDKTQITFGELIDILSKPEKIAVKVENEREFKALMKYYDGLGWKWADGAKPFEYKPWNHLEVIPFENMFWNGREYDALRDNYTIIPFQQFAKEHNIKVPLYVNIVGDEFYQDSPCFWIYKFDGKWMPGTECGFDSRHISMIEKSINKECQTPFPTKESALKWIEEQKPKPIQLLHGMKCVIKEKVSKNHEIEIYDADDLVTVLSPSDIQSIAKAMEELK